MWTKIDAENEYYGYVETAGRLVAVGSRQDMLRPHRYLHIFESILLLRSKPIKSLSQSVAGAHRTQAS